MTGAESLFIGIVVVAVMSTLLLIAASLMDRRD